VEIIWQFIDLRQELCHGDQRFATVNHIAHIHPKDSIVEMGHESLPIGYAYRKAFLERMTLLKGVGRAYFSCGPVAA
jgi:hypothetical protein